MRERAGHQARRHRSAEECQQDDVLLLDAVLAHHVQRAHDSVARVHDGVHQEHLPLGHVLRELGVDDARLVRVHVGGDEDLADADGAAAVAQALLHGLAAADDADAAVSALVAQSGVLVAGGRRDRSRRVGQQVQALLHHQSDQTVRIKLEVAARGVLVADDGLQFAHVLLARDERQVVADGGCW